MLWLVWLVVVASLGLQRSNMPSKQFRSRSRVVTILLASGSIAAVRVAVFWVSLALYTGHADWRQTVGYALLILNSAVELWIGKASSLGRPGSPLLLTLLIVLTSAALGSTWCYVHFGHRFRGPAS